MNLIDLHCDTVCKLYGKGARLAENNFHISLNKVTNYEKYAQIMAIFIDNKLSDEDGYNRFFELYGYFRAEMVENNERIVQITDGRELSRAWEAGRYAAILSVEDARILAGKIERLNVLHSKGVRLLTLLWSGESCIGGSHNTESGLTDFGLRVTERCFELGIIPDISHASDASASEIIALAQKHRKPVAATHSNSYGVLPHSRNLRDDHFTAIRDLGGIVGVNLYGPHLSQGSKAALDDVIRHIDHYLSLGGEDTIALGCDLDGTDLDGTVEEIANRFQACGTEGVGSGIGLPDGVADVTNLTKIADKMIDLGFSDAVVEKLFWKNTARFIEDNIR